MVAVPDRPAIEVETFESPYDAPVPARTRSHDLALAVLQQSIDDLRRFHDARDARSRRMYREVQTWIRTNDRTHVFSFDSICDALGLSITAMRAQLLGRSRPRG